MSIFKTISTKGLPLRTSRWCCEFLKEVGGVGRTVLTGIRWEESVARRRRQMIEVSCAGRFRAKLFVHAIIDWTKEEIWEYIHANKIPYCSLYDEGFDRLGCVLCPMTSHIETLKEMQRWPKLADAWKRATIRLWENRKAKNSPGASYWSSGEEMFRWWLTRRARDKDEGQCRMFDN